MSTSTAQQLTTTTHRGGEEQDWWRDGVIYQVYPRSFKDGSGDGIGDLAGIIDELDHIASLGVSGIWLSPFYPSPGADQGYDVSDYVSVAPEYGTLADVEALLAGAHTRGLKVIVDVVANHCSVEHPLFRAAVAAGPGSPERGRFHFADGRGVDGNEPPNNWRSMFGGPAWSRLPDGQWYLHLFTDAQPDLNWRHPATARDFERILRFWLDLGVDGFRIDAAQGLFKESELPDVADPFEEERVADAANPHAWDQPETIQTYRAWRRLIDDYDARDGRSRVLIGEITGIGGRNLAAYVGPDRLHQGFYFDLMKTPWRPSALHECVDRGLRLAEETGAPTTWVLGNHDTVRPATRLGGGGPGVGPGDREVGAALARAAALFTFGLPGCAYIYQGEELGLPEVVDLPEELLRDPIFRRTGGRRRGRDGCRVPLPWDPQGPGLGFSAHSTLWLPQPPEFAAYAVATQDGQPGSTLELYRAALRLRRCIASDSPFAWSDLPGGLLGYRRGTSLEVILNLTDRRVPLSGRVPLLASGPTEEGLAPYAACWLPVDSRADLPRTDPSSGGIS